MNEMKVKLIYVNERHIVRDKLPMANYGTTYWDTLIRAGQDDWFGLCRK